MNQQMQINSVNNCLAVDCNLASLSLPCCLSSSSSTSSLSSTSSSIMSANNKQQKITHLLTSNNNNTTSTTTTTTTTISTISNMPSAIKNTYLLNKKLNLLNGPKKQPSKSSSSVATSTAGAIQPFLINNSKKYLSSSSDCLSSDEGYFGSFSDTSLGLNNNSNNKL